MNNDIEFKNRLAEHYFGETARPFVDDGFGNLWERAGSYYNDHPNTPILHSRMMKMGCVWYFDTIFSSHFDKN
jgi:hypothetical protein